MLEMLLGEIRILKIEGGEKAVPSDGCPKTK